MDLKSPVSKEKPLSLKTLPVRIIIPVVMTILLFVLTLFLLVIPILEKSMMNGKRESILQLTETAWSILSFYHTKSQEGQLMEEKARSLAIRRDEGGIGLGLSISEKIINDHMGFLDFNSKLKGELTARILLPY
jgi:hypothetical protein